MVLRQAQHLAVRPTPALFPAPPIMYPWHLLEAWASSRPAQQVSVFMKPPYLLVCEWYVSTVTRLWVRKLTVSCWTQMMQRRRAPIAPLLPPPAHLSPTTPLPPPPLHLEA
jgi:hypothetical protein